MTESFLARQIKIYFRKFNKKNQKNILILIFLFEKLLFVKIVNYFYEACQVLLNYIISLDQWLISPWLSSGSLQLFGPCEKKTFNPTCFWLLPTLNFQKSISKIWIRNQNLSKVSASHPKIRVNHALKYSFLHLLNFEFNIFGQLEKNFY